jgi:TonB family protein
MVRIVRCAPHANLSLRLSRPRRRCCRRRAFATPATPATAPTPQFTASDVIPDRTGQDDAGALYELRLGGDAMTADEQIARWQAELKAGRARAGSLVGSHLGYVALTSSDCATARDALTQADALGSDQAPWLLAQLAENRSCGEADVAARERWLKKAVTLDYLAAAQRLIALYSPTGAKTDPVSSTHMRESPRVTGKRSTARKAIRAAGPASTWPRCRKWKRRSRPRIASARRPMPRMILKQMLKRHDRFTPSPAAGIQPRRQGCEGLERLGLHRPDSRHYHECAWNLANNCRGAQRLAFVDIINNDTEFMSCKADLKSRDFVTGKVSTLSREVLMGPKATRRLVVGDVYEQPDKSAMTVDCKVVPRLADNAAAGRCKAKLEGTIDAQRFYPASAKNAGIQGDAVVRFWVPPGGVAPVDAEIVRSSGYAALDDAAISTIRSGKFSKDCDYGLSSIRIAFKLQD